MARGPRLHCGVSHQDPCFAEKVGSRRARTTSGMGRAGTCSGLWKWRALFEGEKKGILFVAIVSIVSTLSRHFLWREGTGAKGIG